MKKDNEILISVKPILFAGYNDYPKGGWKDFIGYFESIKEAMRYVEENWREKLLEWAHVVYEGEIVKLLNSVWEWRDAVDD